MKKIPIILGGMITLGAVGASSFLFAQGFFKEIDLLGKKFVLENSKKNYGVKISYYNFEKDGPGLFGSTEKENVDGYNALGKRLKEVMYHGPEIDQLNEIVFGDWKIIDETANGLYIPNTKQIFINIKTFEPYWNNINLNPKDIIDSLTGVVVHEYGHHIMNTYNNSVKPNKDKLSEKGIYHTVIYGKKARVMQGWNKKFVDEFKSALHYNDFNCYPKNEGEFGFIKPDKKVKEKIFSMGNGEDSNAFKLFENSNNKEEADITSKKAFFTNGVYNKKHSPVEGLENAISVFKSSQASSNDSLHYIYSMDELATRQMEQLMYHYPVAITDSNRWGRMVPRDAMDEEKGFSLETFVSDLMRNYIIYSSNRATWNKNNNNGIKLGLFKDPEFGKNLQYMSDNVWGGTHVNFDSNNKVKYSKQEPTNKLLQSAYESLMGVNQSINQIYAKNPSAIYDSITENDSGIWKSEWLNKIKISGFIPKEANYKGLVVNDKAYEFSKNDSSQQTLLTIKDEIFSNAIPKVGFSKSYILNQFIDLKDLSNEEQIYWWDDKNEDGILGKEESVAMKPKSISKTNRLTTYRQFMTENTFAKIDTTEKGVYLYKGGY